LSYIADGDGNEGDCHLGWRGVPAERFDAEFETEIVDCQIEGYDQDIAPELTPTIEFGLGESDVFLEPKAREERDRKDNTEGGYVGSEAKLKVER